MENDDKESDEGLMLSPESTTKEETSEGETVSPFSRGRFNTHSQQYASGGRSTANAAHRPSRQNVHLNKSQDGRNWANHTRSTQGKWLETNKDIDAGMLVQTNLEVSGLTEAIREIIKAVLSNTKGLERTREEMDSQHKSLQGVRKEAMHLERRCNELEEEVVTLRRELKVVHENRELMHSFQEFREVHELKMIDLQQECKRIDTAKIDASSPQLESDSRKYALDTVKTFFTSRNKELKTWIEKKVLALRSSVTQDISDTSDNLMKEINATNDTIQEEVVSICSTAEDVKAKHDAMFGDVFGKFCAFHDKIQNMESFCDLTFTDLREADQYARREIRLLYSAFCTTPSALQTKTSPGWEAYTTPDEVTKQTAWDHEQAKRLDHRLAAWKKLHQPMDNFDPQPVLQVDYESRDNELSKKIAKIRDKYADKDQPSYQRALKVDRERNTTLFGKITRGEYLSEEAIAGFIGAKVFAAFRASTDTLISSVMNSVVEDIKDDLAKESAATTKELKTKVNSQKCVQLIQTNVGDAFFEEKEQNDLKFAQMEKTKLSVELAYEMLREKADVSSLAVKVDRTTVAEMFEFINKKVGIESSDDVVKKSIRNINQRIEALQANKLDRTHPELAVVFEMLKCGSFSPPDANSNTTPTPTPDAIDPSFITHDRPITRSPTPAKGSISGGVNPYARIVKHTPSPPPYEVRGDESYGGGGGGGGGSIEEVLDRRERERQEQQQVLHLRQVAAGTNQRIQSLKRERRNSTPLVDADAYIMDMVRGASDKGKSKDTQVVCPTDPRVSTA